MVDCNLKKSRFCKRIVVRLSEEERDKMVDGTNEVAEQQEDFDYESIVLRRADPDDFDEILNLVEIGEDDIYNRVYSFPNVLKLIETAYLAITVIDREGRVVAFAAFEDYPSVSIYQIKAVVTVISLLGTGHARHD